MRIPAAAAGQRDLGQREQDVGAVLAVEQHPEHDPDHDDDEAQVHVDLEAAGPRRVRAPGRHHVGHHAAISTSSSGLVVRLAAVASPRAQSHQAPGCSARGQAHYSPPSAWRSAAATRAVTAPAPTRPSTAATPTTGPQAEPLTSSSRAAVVDEVGHLAPPSPPTPAPASRSVPVDVVVRSPSTVVAVDPSSRSVDAVGPPVDAGGAVATVDRDAWWWSLGRSWSWWRRAARAAASAAAVAVAEGPALHAPGGWHAVAAPELL